jgi:tRNA(adenine34) deaminase
MQDYEKWMRRCLELAEQAALKDEVPIGAVVVHKGVIIAEAFNLRETQQSPSGHAELLAIEEASRKLGQWRLLGCQLVTTLEPCVMCAGALLQARVETVAYGASDPKGGAESLFGILSSGKLNHQVALVSGVLEADCAQLLKDFFKKKRT